MTAACPGLANVWDPGWPVPNDAEPVGVTFSLALRCPSCGGSFTRWAFGSGVMRHAAGAASGSASGRAPAEVRIPAADPRAGMTAGELADAVEGLERDTVVRGEAGFRGQIRAVKFVR